MYRITIKEGKDKAPRRHHPWIFSGAIEKTEPPFTEADWAEVVSEAGMFIAYGWYDEESHITLRLMSWKKNEKLNPQFKRAVESPQPVFAVLFRTDGSPPPVQINLMQVSWLTV